MHCTKRMTTPEDVSQKTQQEWLDIFVSATGTSEITEQQDRETGKRVIDTIEAEKTASQ